MARFGAAEDGIPKSTTISENEMGEAAGGNRVNFDNMEVLIPNKMFHRRDWALKKWRNRIRADVRVLLQLVLTGVLYLILVGYGNMLTIYMI